MIGARLASGLLADTRVRFLIAGGSAALLNWLVRFPLDLILPFWAAVAAALVVGMTYGFIIYRAWAFRAKTTRPLMVEIRDFLAVNAAGATVTLLLASATQFILTGFPIDSALADAAAHASGIAAGAVVNYAGHKHLTFRA
jgi:energy-coupling factor transport system substrate-specific component